MLDLVYAGGMVLDGAGGRPFGADVGITAGKITAVGSLGQSLRRTTIDVSGLCVAPGFIDIHSHSDFACVGDGLAESKVRQGVTTELVGNCGSSAAPLIGPAREAAGVDSERWGIVPGWRTLAEYLGTVERHGTAVNIGTLVGHGTVRLGVMGAGQRAAGAGEMRRLERLVAASIDDGAWGLSSGLFYAPGCYADEDEIAALTAIVSDRDLIYATHIRGETTLLRQSLAEAVAVAQRTGVRLQISHLKAAGIDNHGTMPELLAMLDRAAADGIRVHADVYPYEAGHTSLGALLPPWAQAGGARAISSRLRANGLRERVESELGQRADAWDNLGLAAGWDRIVIARSATGDAGLVGRSVADLAREKSLSAERMVCELVVDGEGTAGILAFMLDPGDVLTALAWHRAVVGTDAAAVSGGGIGADGRPHPRCAGTFPRVLGPIVRDGTVSLARAVNMMTAASADIIGLSDRGRLQPGLAADIVVFDPDSVGDGATYDQPLLPPRGILWVMVNGVIVVADGVPTGRMPGRALRSGGTGRS